MDYLSTRGRAPVVSFEDALLAGLAPDGGLYVPRRWPQQASAKIQALSNKPYAETAAYLIGLFAGGAFSESELSEFSERAYSRFDHNDVAPLSQVGDQDWILELFHGPTLAFKDFAMQFLGEMFDAALARRSERRTIIAATSGDTGAAAIDALKRCQNIDVVVLHPRGRVTDVQRRMMTCVDAANVHNIAVEGSFDDCQAIVKELFADKEFVEQVGLSGVNSINWARLAAQIVYYFTASAAIASIDEPVSFVVPTGNFGDIFAGYGAKRIGLAVNKLAVATNANDILHRALTVGDYSPARVLPTFSPSMDIQVASNFERLLFETMDRDTDKLRAEMLAFKENGAMQLDSEVQSRIREDFVSFASGEEETLSEIKRHHEVTGALIDPHTAVGRVAAQALRQAGALTGKVVTLSTAHPAKFPDAVEKATGQRPTLPPLHADLFARTEHMVTASANLGAVKEIITGRLAEAGAL